MGLALNLNISFKSITCAYDNCQRHFALPSNMVDYYRETKKSFYCPYCKGQQGWYGDNETDKLKKQIEALERGKKFAEQRAEREKRSATYYKNSARSQKAAKTRLKNRIKHGVCPCCKRTFKQLAEHMKTMHPEYLKEIEK